MHKKLLIKCCYYAKIDTYGKMCRKQALHKTSRKEKAMSTKIYKYYKEHGEWNDHSNTYGGTFRNLTAACVTFAIAVALLLDKYLG